MALYIPTASHKIARNEALDKPINARSNRSYGHSFVFGQSNDSRTGKGASTAVRRLYFLNILRERMAQKRRRQGTRPYPPLIPAFRNAVKRPSGGNIPETASTRFRSLQTDRFGLHESRAAYPRPGPRLRPHGHGRRLPVLFYVASVYDVDPAMALSPDPMRQRPLGPPSLTSPPAGPRPVRFRQGMGDRLTQRRFKKAPPKPSSTSDDPGLVVSLAGDASLSQETCSANLIGR